MPEKQYDFKQIEAKWQGFWDLRGEFHPDRLPDTVWWAVWDGLEGEIAEQERVTLDIQHSAHRYLRSLEKAVVGFHWSWPETDTEKLRAACI